MNSNPIEIDGLTLTLPSSWQKLDPESSDGLEPVTIGDPRDGVGALQISLAQYSKGKLPKIELADLEEMIEDFTVSRGLGQFIDEKKIIGSVRGIGRTYRFESDMVRVWYCSDGLSVALITYICDWRDKNKENEVVERAINSMRFSQRDL